MKRTDSAAAPHAESCVAVLAYVMRKLELSPVAMVYVRGSSELTQLHAAAKHALDGERLEHVLCRNDRCGLVSFLAASTPFAFKCPLCGSKSGEVLP